MQKLSARSSLFVTVLQTFGGYASTKQIAPYVSRTVNATSRVLGGMKDLVDRAGGGTGGEAVWKLKQEEIPVRVKIYPAAGVVLSTEVVQDISRLVSSFGAVSEIEVEKLGIFASFVITIPTRKRAVAIEAILKAKRLILRSPMVDSCDCYAWPALGF